MSNQLTHSEFLAHIKKHGATKTRITEDYRDYEKGEVYKFKQFELCSGIFQEGKNFWITDKYTGKFELVEESQEEATEEELRKYSTRNYYPPFEGEIKGFNQSIIKKTMNKVTKFIKNATLSADDKLLRENGLMDECGNFTESYHDVKELITDQEYKEKVVAQLKATLEAEKEK